MNSILFTMENKNDSNSFGLFEIDKNMSVWIKEVDVNLTQNEHSSFMMFSDIDELINSLVSARNAITNESQVTILQTESNKIKVMLDVNR